MSWSVSRPFRDPARATEGSAISARAATSMGLESSIVNSLQTVIFWTMGKPHSRRNFPICLRVRRRFGSIASIASPLEKAGNRR